MSLALEIYNYEFSASLIHGFEEGGIIYYYIPYIPCIYDIMESFAI